MKSHLSKYVYMFEMSVMNETELRFYTPPTEKR